MSLPDQEARAMRRAWKFLLDVGSDRKLMPVTPVREEARDILRHFPLGGRPDTLERKAIERGEVQDV